MNKPPTGHALGRKLGDILGEQGLKVRLAASRHEQADIVKRQRDVMEHFEREMAPALRALLGHVVDDENMPDEIRDYFREFTQPTHQYNLFLMLAAVLGIGLSGPPAAAAGLIQRLQAESLHKWGDVPLTPAEAATGVVKGWLSEGEGGAQAKLAGVHDENFRAMVAITGNPPGPETLLTMLNRVIIDEARFRQGIKQGLIREEWADEILALRFAPISVPEAIAAEVEGHIDSGMAKSFMFSNGISEEWHDILYETAGRPPGIQELLELLNRGEVGESDVVQAIRESDIKNKYTDAILKMRRRLMPERTVVSGVRQGVLTHDQGIERLRMLGFNAEDAAALVAEAKTTKMAKHRELAESMVVAGYEDGMIPIGEAGTMLEKLGYDNAEVHMILQLADHRREDRFRQAGVARIHSLFVSHHIDNSKASNALDSLGVHPTMRADLLKLWDLERSANVPRLTVAEQQGLWKRGALTDAEFVRRMETYGYTPEDAQDLLILASPAPTGGSRRSIGQPGG